MGILSYISRTSAFDEKLMDLRPRLWRIAYAWCHNRALADDLVQEACAKSLSQHGQIRNADALNGWLYRILANCWHDHLRRQKGLVDIDEVAEEMLPSTEGNSPEDDYLQSEIVQRVRWAVSLLPVGQREVVTLVDLDELTYAEVAMILEIPIGTVMSRLSRARSALRDSLKNFSTAGAAMATVHRLHG